MNVMLFIQELDDNIYQYRCLACHTIIETRLKEEIWKYCPVCGIVIERFLYPEDNQ